VGENPFLADCTHLDIAVYSPLAWQGYFQEIFEVVQPNMEIFF
jgi:hypothetical protein